MTTHPNILLITADHLRHDTLGYAGDPVIRTPAIDALAERSVRFESFFSVSPVCQPARATLMTGRHPRHNGVRWNFNALDENEVTLVEFLKREGYTTASIGKHHLDQKRFERALDHVEGNSLRNMHPDNPFVEYVKARGYEYRTGDALPRLREDLGAVPSDLPEDCHLDAYVGQRACQYVDTLDSARPFFLWVGFYGPHHPYVPSGRFAHMYDPDEVPPFHVAPDDLDLKPVEYRLYADVEQHKFRGHRQAPASAFRKMKAAYYGMVSQMDWQIGLLLDTLVKSKLAENTIIVFTSDHGEFLGDHGFPGKGPFLLDCMLHVPCLIHVPDGPANVSHTELVECTDLFPTVVRLAGFDAPYWVQGHDFSSLFTHPDTPRPPREAVWAEAVDKKCLRTKEWKLIHYPTKPYGELYHLSEDPWELRNLYADRPDVRERLTYQLYRFMDANEDFRHPAYLQFSGVDPATGQEVRHYHTW